MRGEILSVGTELLLGHLVDTNAPYLAQSLSALGIDTFWICQVGDNQERLAGAIRRGWERSDLIVITGGLGPTGDDLTRESIAEVLGEEMTVQPDLERELRAFFARRRRPMPEHNVKQASLIPSATTLLNPIGTAPGWWVERNHHVIVAMPGVPVEMKRMWTELVVPRLSQRTGGNTIVSRTIKTLGIGESSAEAQLLPFTGGSNPTVATYAKQDGVHVRITAKAPTEDQARHMIGEIETGVRQVLGDNVYGVDDESVPDAIGKLLRDQNLTLCTLESGTAGELASALAGSSEAAATFQGGLVVLGPELLSNFGVNSRLIAAHGVQSEEVVRAMATAARETVGAKVGLAATCEGGSPAGGPDNSGAVYFAVDWAGDVSSSTNRYSSTQRDLRRRGVLDAMDLLRRRLLAGSG